MISMRIVRKPRKQHTCQGCKKAITGTHVYCFGGEEFGKPGAIRLCIPCALDTEETIEEIVDFVILSLTRLVEIPSSQQHQGLYRDKVRLVWLCPICGGPRGDVYQTPSFDGSLRMIVDGWKNDCGHVDYYVDVRNEALANGMNAVREVAAK